MQAIAAWPASPKARIARGQQEEKDQDKSLHSFGCVFSNTSPTRSTSGTYPDEYSVQGKSQSFDCRTSCRHGPFVIGSYSIGIRISVGSKGELRSGSGIPYAASATALTIRITPPRRNTLSEMKKYARPQFIPTPIPADRRHDGRCRQESRRPMQQTALRPDPARCRPTATKRRCAGSEGVSLRITVTFVPPLPKNETEPNPAGFGSASSERRRIT